MFFFSNSRAAAADRSIMEKSEVFPFFSYLFMGTKFSTALFSSICRKLHFLLLLHPLQFRVAKISLEFLGLKRSGKVGHASNVRPGVPQATKQLNRQQLIICTNFHSTKLLIFDGFKLLKFDDKMSPLSWSARNKKMGAI